MAQLERNPDGLKMGELSQRLMVTGGNITGLTDQLVKEGLVKRRPIDDVRHEGHPPAPEPMRCADYPCAAAGEQHQTRRPRLRRASPSAPRKQAPRRDG